MRFVRRVPGKDGKIEIGPWANALAMGDTLMLTPVAKALGNKAVVCLPEKCKRFAFFFRGFCDVRITENYPLIPFGRELLSKQALRYFNFGHLDPLPRINLDEDTKKKAKPLVNGFPNPIAFVPTCSKNWAHIRQRPAFFWKPVVEELHKRYEVLQFGFQDYPLVPGAIRMPFVDLETLAGVYSLIGNYVGTDTGDYHLMLAVGGRAVVAEPEPMPKQMLMFWLYESPRVQYGKLSHPGTMLAAIKRIGL